MATKTGSGRLDETPVRRQSGMLVDQPSPGTPRSGDPTAGPPSLAQLNKLPTWLIPAWNVFNASAPNVMDFKALLLAVDAYQGGWPFAVPIQVQILQSAGQAANIASLLSQVPAAGLSYITTGVPKLDLSLTYRVLGFSCTHTGGAAAATVAVFLSPQRVPQAAANLQLTSASITNGGITAGYTDGFKQTAPWWLMSPYDLNISFPATAGGESFTFNVALEAVPAGTMATG